VTPFQPPEIKA